MALEAITAVEALAVNARILQALIDIHTNLLVIWHQHLTRRTSAQVQKT